MQEILQNIHSPEDLRALDAKHYAQLAKEIRAELIQTISKNGGHLASNLGVVELTMALHLCFETPKDALVWDVSHQCYTHKLLTGRRAAFGTIRQSHGLSGFTSPKESAYDLFAAGHASTSVSSALGLAEARKLQGNPHFSVAVLGDGALTGGLAYEALNNAGQSQARLIVVLNDNEMSISRNVGALSRYLSRVRSRPEYRYTKRRVEHILRIIPLVGDRLAMYAASIKRFVKRILTQTNLFEDIGLDYIGPVDGHNIGHLCAALESAKLTPRPALVHVCTVKGKGLESAESAPDQYHGVSRQEPEEEVAGESFTREFSRILCEAAEKDARICAVTAAMAIGTGLEIFQRQFPSRFFDVGIAEGHAVTFAAGLAKQGMRPVVAIYSTFLQRVYDQILHDTALQGLPMVLAVDRAGFVGADGATHHGLYDVAMCAGIPGIQVFAPGTAAELKEIMTKALDSDGIWVVRYPRDVAVQDEAVPWFSSDTFALYGVPGAQTAIITYGRLFYETGILHKKMQVLKLKQLHPIDPQALHSVLDCEQIFFFEEGMRTGGIGERFALELLERGYKGRFHLSTAEGFPRHAQVKELLAEYGLDAAGMEKLC